MRAGGKVVGTDARHGVDKLRQGMTAVDSLQRMIVHRLQAQLDVDIEPTATFPQFRQRFKIGRMHKIWSRRHRKPDDCRICSCSIDDALETRKRHVGVGKCLEIDNEMLAFEAAMVKCFVLGDLLRDGEIVRQRLKSGAAVVAKAAAAC